MYLSRRFFLIAMLEIMYWFCFKVHTKESLFEMSKIQRQVKKDFGPILQDKFTFPPLSCCLAN